MREADQSSNFNRTSPPAGIFTFVSSRYMPSIGPVLDSPIQPPLEQMKQIELLPADRLAELAYNNMDAFGLQLFGQLLVQAEPLAPQQKGVNAVGLPGLCGGRSTERDPQHERYCRNPESVMAHDITLSRFEGRWIEKVFILRKRIS